MKAITVRQPWAECIADGYKLTENRGAGFPAKFRGWVLIHAGAAWSERGQLDTRVRSTFSSRHDDRSMARYVALRHGHPVGNRPVPPFQGGCVLARAWLADVHPDTGCCRPWGESEYVASDGKLRQGVAHLTFEDVQRVGVPIVARGALGLWTAPDDVVAAVDAQLGAVITIEY